MTLMLRWLHKAAELDVMENAGHHLDRGQRVEHMSP